MSNRIEDPSGVVWNQSLQKVPAAFDRPGRWLQATVRKTAANGHFAVALTRAGVDPESLSIELDGRRKHVSVDGLDAMTSLRQLHLADDLAARDHPGALLPQLQDLSMRYSHGVTEELLRSPVEFLTLYAPPPDISSVLGPGLRTARYIHGTGTTFDANILGQRLTDLEFQGGKSADVTGSPSLWPDVVSFVTVPRVSGLVAASRQTPFKTLYLAGVKGLAPRESIWEIHAQQIVIDYATQPPKWLVDQWPSRPHDWHRTLTLSRHPLLEGS